MGLDHLKMDSSLAHLGMHKILRWARLLDRGPTLSHVWPTILLFYTTTLVLHERSWPSTQSCVTYFSFVLYYYSIVTLAIMALHSVLCDLLLFYTNNLMSHWRSWPSTQSCVIYFFCFNLLL